MGRVEPVRHNARAAQLVVVSVDNVQLVEACCKIPGRFLWRTRSALTPARPTRAAASSTETRCPGVAAVRSGSCSGLGRCGTCAWFASRLPPGRRPRGRDSEGEAASSSHELFCFGQFIFSFVLPFVFRLTFFVPVFRCTTCHC